MIRLKHTQNLAARRRAGGILILFLLARSALANTNTVTALDDGGPGSLRDAISAAGAGDTIIFEPSLMGGTIILTNGELLVTNNLTISGPGAANLAISGDHSNRVFEIGANAMVSLTGLTIRDGHAADGYYGYYSSGGDGSSGGGVYNQGTLNLSECALRENSAGDGGAGYFGSGPQGSGAGFPGGNGGAGGGIYNANTLQATACTFSGNQAGFGGHGGNGGDQLGSGGAGGVGGGGGGIHNLGTMTLINCTLSANASGSGGGGGQAYSFKGGSQGGNGGQGGAGGGIFNSGTVTLAACTLSANSAGSGGIIDYGSGHGGNGGSGGSGGGICNAATQTSAELLDTLVASNRPGPGGISYYGTPGVAGACPDLYGRFTSRGYNLIGQTDGSRGFTSGVNADLAGTTANPLDPQLGPLANNGGPTLTMALLHGSPALAAGDDALLGPPYNLTTDQRNFPRTTGAHVDIGAFQFQPIATPPVLITLPDSTASGFQLAFPNTSGATFSVLSATNLSLPSSNWTVIGQALELGLGEFQFTDPQTTNAPQRFYRVSSP